MELNNSNRQVIAEFYQRVLHDGDIEFAKRIVREDYIQHNPEMPSGRAPLLAAVAMLQQMPKPENPQSPAFCMLAEGDLVGVHLYVEFAGQKKLVVDLFRLEGGQLAEHWDASMDAPAEVLLPWQGEVGPAGVYDNKAQIRQLDALRSSGKAMEEAAMAAFVGEEILGSTAWQKQIAEVEARQVHRRISEGNLVLTQADVLREGVAQVAYDMYRMAEGKIVEHWNVSQPIPAEMAHGNGMI